MEWIKCSDRAPFEDGLYDVCYEATELSERCCGREYFLNRQWVVSPYGLHNNIIYWKPLPHPPEK